MERGVKKGGKWEDRLRKRGLRRKDERTSYAAVIWTEYKADERERTYVQLTYLHTVFVCLQKCLTGLQWEQKGGGG